MTIPTSMGVHKLEVLKGKRDDLVDYTGILDAAANQAAVVAGRVLTQNGGGFLIPGLAVASIPFFSWSGLDVNNYPDILRTRGMPDAGAMRCGTISAFAAAELSTTEFDTTKTYTPGAPLTALSTAATVPANAGLLTPLVAATDVIVGFVGPEGVVTSADGYPTLCFYPAYVRGTTVLAA